MKTYLIGSGLLLWLTTGCTKPVAPQPTPSQAIAGNYTAKSTLSFSETKTYPINGKTITFQISPVSADTVQVRLQALANGNYSPAKDTTYAKVYVLTTNQGYYLTLEKPLHPGTGENQISIASGSAYYTFVPPGYTLGGISVVFNRDNQ